MFRWLLCQRVKNSTPAISRFASVVPWFVRRFLETLVVAQLGKRPQISTHLDGKILYRRYAIHSVHHQPNGEIRCSRVSVRNLGIIGTGTVSKIPMVAQRRCAAIF